MANPNSLSQNSHNTIKFVSFKLLQMLQVEEVVTDEKLLKNEIDRIITQLPNCVYRYCIQKN